MIYDQGVEPEGELEGELELEPGNPEFSPVVDRRARMDEPLPVRLIAIADVRLKAPAGVEKQLDLFYVTMLGFERMAPPEELIYRADNFLLKFQLAERPVVHDSLRAIAIEVVSLREAEQKLIDAELEYTRQRGISPGGDSLVLLDPAGNWVELVEQRVLP
jgi:hypothetical protein